MSVLSVLLLFAGVKLAMSILVLKERKELFVAVLTLRVTLASNLAAGFMTGTAAAYILIWCKFGG